MNSRHFKIVAAVILSGIGTTFAQHENHAHAADKTSTTAVAVKKQTACPVMGGAINTNLYADANGKRVYFCCNGCPAEFKKDPAKHIAKMEKDGITLDKTPTDGQTKSQAKDAGATTHSHCNM